MRQGTALRSAFEFPRIGTIGWFDLTGPGEQAEAIRDFYYAEVGWQWTAHDMGAYDDYDSQTGASQFAVIQDPARAVAALISPSDAASGKDLQQAV